MARGEKKRGLSLIDGENGTIRKEAGAVVALGYPASYAVAASSLGAQTVYRLLNQTPGLACARFFLPDAGPVRRPLVTVEHGRPVSSASAIAFSISCEADLIGVAGLLEAAGLDPLSERRAPDSLAVIIGGPLTLLDPRLVAPFADAVAVGEAEEALPLLGEAVVASVGREDLIDRLKGSCPGLWIPSAGGDPPLPATAPLHALPAFAATWSQRAELKNLFLVEATRGCARSCAFCVLSSKACGSRPFRAVDEDLVFESIPEAALDVGLVGAAVTDHPRIDDLVERIVASGRRVSLSSIRADRFSPRLARALKAGGLDTITLAADGSSERLRTSVKKGISAGDLTRAAKTAAEAGIRSVKLYSMVGLPGEDDCDVEELASLLKEMARFIKVSIAVQAFVPKPGTPLSGEVMAEAQLIRHRIDLLKRRVAGRARLLPTSPRWSWLDWKLAHAGERAALAAVAAQRGGGGFAAWRKAVLDLGL